MDVYEAEQLGFEDYPLAYAQASGEDILRGVNYASAAAGIREETGQQLVSHHPLFCAYLRWAIGKIKRKLCISSNYEVLCHKFNIVSRNF